MRALAPVLEERLANRGMWELATTLEFPLVGVLARMEEAGVLVDREYLEELDGELGERAAGLERTIQDLAGEPFNVNSTPQLQRVLFETLGLPKTRRIKTGYSTDATELAKLTGAHPIVDRLLEYREVAKLRSGFTESLLALVDPASGRIHTTYGQTSAATGRIASTAPNLQNVPFAGSSDGASGVPSSRPPVIACSRPTTRRSSSACSLTFRRTRASSMPSPRRTISTLRSRPRSTVSKRPRSRPRCGAA